MSRLESLPTELIEAIFLQSLNLSLPRASKFLGAALSSSRLRLNLVLKAFPSGSGHNLGRYGELQRALWTVCERTTEDAMTDLQSSILQCRWLTWDFLKTCMKTFVVKTILREFREQNLLWRDGQPVRDCAVQEFIDEIFDLNVQVGVEDERLDDIQRTKEERIAYYKELKALRLAEDEKHEEEDEEEEEEEEEITNDEEPSDIDDGDDPDAGYDCLGVIHDELNADGTRKGFIDTIITSSLRTWSWKSSDSVSPVALGVGPRNGLVIIGSRIQCEDDTSMVMDECSRWRCLFGYSGCDIPKKLLHGPWTKEKLHFLEAACEAHATANLWKRDVREIAESGLLEAIREDNYRAVDILANESADAQHSECHEDMYVEPTFTETGFCMEYTKYATGWDHTTEYVNNPMPRQTLDIKPNTEHLKVAVLERGCRRMVVRRLLFARDTEIDRDDEAITAWIKAKKGESDGKAQWLQNQLTRSGEMESRAREKLRRYSEDSSSWCSSTDDENDEDLDRFGG